MSKRSIKKSSGANHSENTLATLCDNTFLKLWSYPNPYKKKGTELCDVIVIFEEHVFIFSVKEIKFNTNKDIDIAWQRWHQKAINKSIQQIKAASNWIKTQGNKIFLDSACENRLPVDIDLENYKLHRIVVAHGVEDACMNFSKDNIHGSLGIIYTDPTPEKTPPFPFTVKLPREQVYHILDSFNLNILLNELDTITDLINYLEAKENAIKKYRHIAYAGEEELLAHYYLNFDPLTNSHYIGTQQESIDAIMIPEGEWQAFTSTFSYQRKKEDDKISYLWDELLQRTFQYALDGEILGDDDIFNQQSALREMAKEPRFMRRELALAMQKSIQSLPYKHGNLGRQVSSYPSFFHNKRYVFLQLIPDKTLDYENEYRPLRQEMLSIACGVLKNISHEARKIIGIAIDAPNYTSGNSEDFILLDCSTWRREDREYYKQANKEFCFFKSKNAKWRVKTASEFPNTSNKRNAKKVGVNSPCPCGSNKKYKRCCRLKDL